MNQSGVHGRWATAIISGALIAVIGVATVLAQALGPAGPSPAEDNAAVVAHAVVELPAGETVWRIRNLQIDGDTAPISGDVPALLTTDGVPVLVEDLSTGLRQRVASGEGAVLVPGNESSVTSMGPPQSVLAVDVMPVDEASLSGSPGRISVPFQVEGGSYDVDLIRIRLDEGESSTVPMGNGQSLIVVRSGQVDVQAEDEQFSMTAGGDRLASGELTITATSDEAAVVVARIGPAIESIEEPATPVASQELETPEATPEPTATPVPATPVATPSPATPVAEEPQDIDSDGDGVDNADEIAAGTNPDDPDTDDDGLFDGVEIELGTDPLSADTDEDGILDGDEVFSAGTDPLNSDTDGDVLYDGGELLYNTDPLVVDTDVDGLTDGDEVYFSETSPTAVDTDGDGRTDYDEVVAGTDPLDANSFP
ncbi:MAG TPA: hypothetical protein VGR22_03625 [Thermomicrobiales bacterium]|nr:hypothetical protein [Thermomicrobiales bacterium]